MDTFTIKHILITIKLVKKTKIFHALGTKDKIVAKQKQEEFDKIYKLKDQPKDTTTSPLIKFFIMVVIVIGTIYYLFNQNSAKIVEKKKTTWF